MQRHSRIQRIKVHALYQNPKGIKFAFLLKELIAGTHGIKFERVLCSGSLVMSSQMHVISLLNIISACWILSAI